jgi:hypothetical protein
MGDEHPFGYKGMIRNPDHSTSKKAARKVRVGLTEKQQLVIDVLKDFPGGLNDTELRLEIAKRGHVVGGESTYRRRRTELVELGLVEHAGHSRPNQNGNSEKVWVLAPMKS